MSAKEESVTMKAPYGEALEVLGKTFEDRIKQRVARRRERDAEDHLAFVLPVSVEEVELLAEVAARYSVPLIALGARTSPDLETSSEQGSILVRFDLMRRTRLPEDPEELWVWTEPGKPWRELDNDLHARGRGLTVYPTSAPRATVGGWLATDGLGVGSFEYGWLSENVLLADVVLVGGERRTVRGEDLRSFVGPSGGGIVVDARLRTRRMEGDLPFGIAFESSKDLAEAVADAFYSGAPLWHLAFLNPRMALAKGHGERYLLFGAYTHEHAASIEEAMRDVPAVRRGWVLPPGDAYRIWTERFFPVAPSHPTPNATREFISVAKLSEALGGERDRPERAIQGTVARSREVLLLTFDSIEEGWEGPGHGGRTREI
jgi:FAD/FMN-containing dehydrogenase